MWEGGTIRYVFENDVSPTDRARFRNAADAWATAAVAVVTFVDVTDRRHGPLVLRVRNNRADHVYLKSVQNGKSVVVRSDGYAASTGGRRGHKFRLVEVGRDRVAFRSVDSESYLGARGRQQLLATRSSARGVSETFERVDLGGWRIALRAADGRFVRAGVGASTRLAAVSDRADPQGWEAFEVVEAETGGGCTVGPRAIESSLDPRPRMRIARGLGLATMFHELGHGLALVHEHERDDRPIYLKVQDWDGSRSNLESIPLLGNYDYDSVMHYVSRDRDGVLRFTDLSDNEFARGSLISPRDASRVLQYYAHEHQHNWGFFSRAHRHGWLRDDEVRVLGSPAVAAVSGDDYHLFVRGSDDHLYWKHHRRGSSAARQGWSDIGGQIGSDPAAIAFPDGQVNVVFFGAQSGKLIHLRRRNGGRWSRWNYARDDVPAGGIRPLGDGGVAGPAVTSPRPGELAVFAVRADGQLASVHLKRDGWTHWYTAPFDGRYRVSVRPAAVALSSTVVRLAMATDDGRLYLPTAELRGNAPWRFTLGRASSSAIAPATSPAMTRRAENRRPFRVLFTNPMGRVSQMIPGKPPRDIGGIPLAGTGPAAAAVGRFGALIAMNGENVLSADAAFTAGPARGAEIEPGPTWVRLFR